MKSHHAFHRRDAEDFDRAIYIREIDACAIRREDEPRETDLPVFVRIQESRRRFARTRWIFSFRRKRNALHHCTSVGIDHHELSSFSRCDKPFAVWTQRDDLRSHAWQFDLHAVGREPLVRRRVVAVGGNLADRFTRRGWNLRNGKDTKREAHEWLHRVMSVSDERLLARISIATD